jgi:hypothetical protein
MKKNQKEILNVIHKIFDALSQEYIYDLLIPNYKDLLWNNLSSSNRKIYIDSTINLYAKHNEYFDVQKMHHIKDELLNIVKYDKVIEFDGALIYKELYKILWLIDMTFQALEILRAKNYPRDFGKFQSNKEKINSKRAFYKNYIVGDDKLTNRKEVRFRYWSYTLYYKNKNLVEFFLYGFLLGDLIKFKDLHEENEVNELFLSNLTYFLMQKTTTDAVIKSLGILLYGEFTEYLKIPKVKSKRLIQWIIDALFHSNINTDEFSGHIHIKSSLGFYPVFGASRKAKYSDEEKEFMKKRLLKDIKELALIDEETFNTAYEKNTKNPHIQFLAKYPLELFQENPKYSDINI